MQSEIDQVRSGMETWARDKSALIGAHVEMIRKSLTALKVAPDNMPLLRQTERNVRRLELLVSDHQR